jgi:thioredoxin 1
MLKYLFFLALGFAPLIQSCSNAQCQPGGTIFAAAAFSEKLQACPDAVLLDVRTPEEFEKGHLVNALNINWNSQDFGSLTAKLDKSKPVFVYCLSGGRSTAAAEKMRADGFKTVVELEGGIMKWRTAKLPETKGDPLKTTGMSPSDFEALLKTDKLVLVDFYADWCVPCKKMEPYLNEIKQEMADKVSVLRINADDNQNILQHLGIEALPVLLIYKNGRQVWRNEGFIEKAGVVAQLGQ